MSSKEQFTTRQYNKMVSELLELKKNYSNPDELDSFVSLYKRWLVEREYKIEWSKIEEPRGLIYKYEELGEFTERKLIDKLAVLKLQH